MPKKITPELRDRAVRMVAEHRPDYPSLTAAVQAVARRLGLGRETVRRWVVQADIDAGGRPGVSSQENAEIRRLKGRTAGCGRMWRFSRRPRFSSVNAILSGAWRGSLVSLLPRSSMACPRCVGRRRAGEVRPDRR